ncbi:SpvB/TcaC N-terminal domain-containing protein [Bradyrhizobium prioriisuperbiae]|uniref:SpvB/TcaC N-terminal domain-containing protein n=1 Tax=Bradyrhizobium prioriisuperbiae TaxID=2854389 RepID=UPI0028E24869|nr:SpvB/TcaC N-terminal domain-containing protein [Bradyrhizobium prioritasuperba]
MPRATDRQASTIALPKLTLPSGGGQTGAPPTAFVADENLGSGTLIFPFDFPVARELTLQLAISYASGGGSGLFGAGFSVDIPSFSLNTRFGVPRYDGKDPVTFAGDDLVPALLPDPEGQWIPEVLRRTEDGAAFDVMRYQPRIESQFTLIEHWVEIASRQSHWRTTSTDNVVSVYGKTPAARVADPLDQSRIVEWFIEQSENPKGERIAFHYIAENRDNVPDRPADQGGIVAANRYPHRIAYGNYIVDGANGDVERFAYEIVFDYGGFDFDAPLQPPASWPVRSDPFSSYISGFERRTLRLCRGLLAYVSLPELFDGRRTLTRAYRFGYEQQPFVALLTSIEQIGYRWQPDGTTWSRAAMPALSLTYSGFTPAAGTFHTLTTAQRIPAAPGYLDPPGFQLVDLNGDGLPGILQSTASSTIYWSPDGNGRYTQDGPRQFPIERDLGRPDLALLDLDSNGHLDLVVTSPSRAGYYRHEDAQWHTFQPFGNAPTSLANEQTQYVDLSGNGLADLVLFSGRNLLVYPSLGSDGFGPAQRRTRPFPLASPGDGTMLTTFADMFGDGLQHWVVVTNGEVKCWPSLGRGRFGYPVIFDNAPRFGAEFDARRILLLDADGSGCADLLYLLPDRVELYRNQNGNGFAPPISIPLPEQATTLDRITTADVLGTGCAGLVFTDVIPAATQSFYDFGIDGSANGTKPYLLVETDNHLGALTRIAYRSSTQCFLDDKHAGRPWLTRLPFPVQVVDRLEVLEQVTGSRLVRTFSYHDGYFDAADREFCGFACVERRDSESFDTFKRSGLFASADFHAGEAPIHQPPALTRTWYDVGAYDPTGALARAQRLQYFQGDPDAAPILGNRLDPTIWDYSRPLLRQAQSASKGRIIREEIYGEDGSALAAVPYKVTQNRLFIRLLQPTADNIFASFLVADCETIVYDYEREANDPQVSHSFALEIDAFGNVVRDCGVNYPRHPKVGAGDDNPATGRVPEQDVLHASATLTDVINVTDGMRWIGLTCQERTLQLHGLDPGPSGYFSFEQIGKQVEQALADTVPYASPFKPAARQARTQDISRVYFWNETQTAALPLGQTGTRALEHHEAEAVFPDGLLRAQHLFRASASLIPELNQAILPVALRDQFALASIALPAGALSTVTVVTSSQLWTVTDLSTGQAYPIAVDGSDLLVTREVLGTLADGLPEQAGYALEDGYWWNRGEVGIYFTAPKQFYMLSAIENLFAAAGSTLHSKSVLSYDQAQLHVTTLSQWLSDSEQNVTRLAMDYQALLPAWVTNPNLVVSEALYDPLARLIATSLHKGATGDKPLSDYVVRTGATLSDVVARPAYYLQGASSFQFTDMFAWSTDRRPTAVCSLARETHVSDLVAGEVSAIKLEIGFRDGLAREIEIKKVSDPGEAIIRTPAGALARTADGAVQRAVVAERYWVSGRTVFNNKGMPVKVYLPYFSNTPLYEDRTDVAEAGLLPPPTIVHYDALNRATRVDTPKKFFNLNVYRAWTRWLYDEDDTVKQSTYYQLNIDNPQTPLAEREALRKAAIFNDTPDVLILDPTGEPVRRVQIQVEADNGVPGAPRYLTTRRTLDADGGTIAIADPRLMALTPPVDNVQFLLDMSGTALLEVAVDSGRRAQCADINGNPIRLCDGRGVEIAKSYDRLQRLGDIRVRSSAEAPWWTAERIVYGEGQAGDIDHNLREQVYRSFDQGGTATYPDYNIQAQPLVLERQLTQAYSGEIDWSQTTPAALEAVPLVERWRYDALRRVTEEQSPDGRRIVPRYGPSTLLTSLTLEQDGTSRPIVTEIEHDASNQRVRIALANQAVSRFDYEPTTLRLLNVKTERPDASGTKTIQDRSYTYDPVGNVTQTRDNARELVFFRQQAVSPVSDYTTDSLYRLLRATGVQQPALAMNRENNPRPYDVNNREELETYLQTYTYDDGNNLTEMRHTAASGNWTRRIAIAPLSNRGAPVDDPLAAYDRNGNMTDLGALSGMEWSWRNGLLDVASIKREPGDADDSASFQYDARGRRLRKIVQRKISANETELEETVYLGAYQRRRIIRVQNGSSQIILERHDLQILDDLRYGETSSGGDAASNRDAHGGDTVTPVPRSDGRRAFATEYRWTIDERGRETSSLDTRLTRYPLLTFLGSITIELDDAGSVVSNEEYYPYGVTAAFSAVAPGEQSLKMYRYVGKERDATTGLYYFGARYYGPSLGRWLSADPAGFNDGTNLYLYVGGNPVSYTDPTGLAKAKNKVTVSDLQTKLATAKGRLKKAEKRVAQAESQVQANKGLKLYAKKLLEARRERTSARAQVTRISNQLIKLKSASSSTIPTIPGFYNPGGPLVILQPPTHTGSGGTIVTSPPSTAYIADLHKTQRSSAVESDVRNYSLMANRYIQSQPSKQLVCVSSDRKTTGSIGYQAGQIATKERDLANTASSGTYASDQVVGHVPDVAATGLPYSPLGWFQQTKISNSIVGGGLYAGRVITVYLVKEQDGKVYHYS